MGPEENGQKKSDPAQFFNKSHLLGLPDTYEPFIMSHEDTSIETIFATNPRHRDYLDVLMFCEALSGEVDDEIWTHEEPGQRILKDAWEKSVELRREGYYVPDIEAIRLLVNQHLCNDGPHQVPEAERTIPTVGVAALAQHNQRTDKAGKLKPAFSGAVVGKHGMFSAPQGAPQDAAQEVDSGPPAAGC